MTRREQAIVASLLTILVALLLVGVVSGTLARHSIQVLPVGVAMLIVLLRPGWSGYAAASVFAFWLFIMSLIWLYLLGLARVVTGHFSATEIGLTVVIGLASILGLIAAVRGPMRSSGWAAAAAFLACGALQVGAMWLSLQPAFGNR